MGTLDYTFGQIAGMIDHSLLNPALKADDLEAGCRLAIEYQTATVCISPYYLWRCAEILAGTSVKPSTTIGFPHGGQMPAVKLLEVTQAVADGAKEIDVVVNIGKVLSDDWSNVTAELKDLIAAAHAGGMKIKVIFENCYLEDKHKIRLCQICGELRADWVKTSTGFGTGGATLDDLKLMRRHSPPFVQVKAAGGIRDLDSLLAVRALGVTRVGATRTACILNECRRRLDGGA